MQRNGVHCQRRVLVLHLPRCFACRIAGRFAEANQHDATQLLPLVDGVPQDCGKQKLPLKEPSMFRWIMPTAVVSQPSVEAARHLASDWQAAYAT